LSPDEQEFKSMLASEAFAPVPGGWGKQGWTTAKLSALSAAELKDALEMAWRHAVPKKQPRPRR
jgi:hypothetical protein